LASQQIYAAYVAPSACETLLSYSDYSSKMASTLIHGFLTVNKPEGLTSRDVVNRLTYIVRRRFDGQKLKTGHCGTLDPLATGVLVVAVGFASRLVTHVQSQKKTYSARFLLGQTRNTDDVTGELTSECSVSEREFPESAILELLPSFKGEIEQTPPVFSAIKIDGSRAYKLARKGQTVEVPPRNVQIHSLKLTDYSLPEFELKVECGSGTYIRSLGRDIGERLGCGATMKSLVRTRVGVFDIANALEMQDISEESVLDQLEPSQRAVPDMLRIQLTADELKQVRNGRPISSGDRMEKLGLSSQDSARHDVVMQTDDGVFVAIGRMDQYIVRSVLVFPDLQGRQP
jgi:tRNA pseudouridine55 synthase